MNFLEKLTKLLEKLTGISETLILLIIYSIIAILIINIISILVKTINNKLNKNEKKRFIFNKKTHIIKIIITILLLLFIWEKQIENIMTFVSFLTAAITVALKDIILNFFAGIYISISKPLRIEDRIQIDGMIGDVVNISSLNFEILEVSNKDEGEQSTGIIVQIPNSKIFTEPIKNYTKAFKYIWSELTVKLNHNADLEKNKKLLYKIVNNNDIVKTIPRKMKNQLNEVIGNYRIYYNNLEPIIYTKLTEECIELNIRYLAHPKKARNIENEIWNKIYEEAKNGKIDLYTK